MKTLQENHQGALLDVALAVRSEVTKYGLERILDSLPIIHRICVDWPVPDVVVDPPKQSTYRVVIVGLQEMAADNVDILLEQARAWGDKVLLLLDSATSIDIARAAGARCDGFLDIGDLTTTTMADALDRLQRGEVPMPVALTRNLLAHVREGVGTSQHAIPINLTPREQQVLSLLVEGLSNKQIARHIAISPHGVKRLVANVLAKLNCPNRTLAVSRALRERLCPMAVGSAVPVA